MQPDNMKSVAIAIVTALGFLLATVPVASAQNITQCTGTISEGSTINSNLVVPANASCTLDNVTVTGNLRVRTGAMLNVLPAPGQTVKISGNLTADQCNAVVLATGGGRDFSRRQCHDPELHEYRRLCRAWHHDLRQFRLR
jgi:hypothetical protein